MKINSKGLPPPNEVLQGKVRVSTLLVVERQTLKIQIQIAEDII